MVTIEPATTNVYATEKHVIRCNLFDIPAQISGEHWTPSVTETDGYTLHDGAFIPDEKSQVSTLTISPKKLVEMRGFAESFEFTCKINVGSSNTIISANQVFTIFNPSKCDIFGQDD